MSPPKSDFTTGEGLGPANKHYIEEGRLRDRGRKVRYIAPIVLGILALGSLIIFLRELLNLYRKLLTINVSPLHGFLIRLDNVFVASCLTALCLGVIYAFIYAANRKREPSNKVIFIPAIFALGVLSVCMLISYIMVGIIITGKVVYYRGSFDAVFVTEFGGGILLSALIASCAFWCVAKYRN